MCCFVDPLSQSMLYATDATYEKALNSDQPSMKRSIYRYLCCLLSVLSNVFHKLSLCNVCISIQNADCSIEEQW